MKKRAMGIALLILASALSSATVYADCGAATVINNKASVNYKIGGVPSAMESNTDSLTVHQIVGVDMTTGISNAVVTCGETGHIHAFEVLNGGNGPDSFKLSAAVVNGTLSAIYLDSNGSGAYEAGTDAIYNAGSNDPVLAAGASMSVFVMCDIAAEVPDGAAVEVELSVKSIRGQEQPAGTLLPGAGIAGADGINTDVVVGPSGSVKRAMVRFVVADISVLMVKTAQIFDQYGRNDPVAGATVRYTITATATGSGTASNLAITDAVPANTSYLAGTLKLNGASLTDDADGDAGETGAGTVTVRLPDMTGSSPAQTIEFDVKID